jgi:hypothetical protein
MAETSGSGAIRAGKAFVEMGTDDTALEKGLADAQQKFSGFFSAVKDLAGALAFGSLSSQITGLVTMWGDAGEKLYKDAKATGGRLEDLVKDPVMVGRAHELTKAFESMDEATKAVKETIGGILAPAFTPVLAAITKQIEGTKEWVKQHEGLIQIIGWSIAGFATLSAGILGVLGIVKMGAVIVGGLSAAFAAVGAVISGLAALMVSPFLLAGIAIAGLAAAVVYLTGAFDNLGALAGRVGTGIVDALKAGDLELAWEIAVLGMKVAWADFGNWFTSTFPTLSRNFSSFCSFIAEQWRGTMWNIAKLGGLIFGGQEMLRDLEREQRGEERLRAMAQGQQLTTPRQDLENALRRAREAKEAAEQKLRDTTFGMPIGGGARGTFNANAAFGLLGPGRDPVVAAIESQGQRQLEEMRLQREQLQEMNEWWRGFVF